MNEETMSELLETLYTHRVDGLPPAALADVLDRLIWCLDDNGASLLKVREAWLQSSEEGKVRVALAMDETLPFDTLERMAAVLDEIARRWPDLANRCADLVARRRTLQTS